MQQSQSASTEKIRILVRVRPLNDSEKSKGHKNVIEQSVDKNSLTIWDPLSFDAQKKNALSSMDAKCWSRVFSYDHCLWSDDEARNSDSQEKVHDTIGTSIVDWAIEGFNTCVLAYGQTGAGKSYTMLGAGENNPSEFGLIPRICFGLFENFDILSREKGVKCTMEFSFLQIYNENLKDCLAPKTSRNLKVREHPKEGSYISNLTTVLVERFEDILSLIAIGNKARAIAATRANIQSSRSHGIVILTVRQRHRSDPLAGMQQKTSRIYLVDLAGSERSSVSGAVGDRLREANNINKSLSVLGDVIKSLGDASKKSGNKRCGHIPYRNSVLTMVLRDSLGGNSHTTMVAAVSPSSADYEETISTLKYADNVKRVRNRVAANVTSEMMASAGAIQLVPVLQAEVQKLREMLKAQQQQQSLSSNISMQDEDALEIMEEMQARVSELEQQLQERESMIKSLEMSMGENGSPVHFASLAASVDKSVDSSIRSQPFIVLADDAVDTSLPRVINLNQDPLFSECLVYYIPDGVAVAGSDEMDVDILLSGPDILPKHCLLHNDHDRVWIEPVSNDSKVYINGKRVLFQTSGDSRVYLSHFDRISLGRYHLFRFEAKGKKRAISPLKKSKSAAASAGFSTEAPGWDFAHDELMLNKDAIYEVEPEPQSLQYESSDEANIHRHRYSRDDSFDGSNLDEEDIIGLWEKVSTVIDGPQKVNSSEELRERVRKIVESAENKIRKNVSEDSIGENGGKEVVPEKSSISARRQNKINEQDKEHVAFEDEASSLQRDMKMMQEKLAQRMKRYDVSSV